MTRSQVLKISLGAGLIWMQMMASSAFAQNQSKAKPEIIPPEKVDVSTKAGQVRDTLRMLFNQEITRFMEQEGRVELEKIMDEWEKAAAKEAEGKNVDLASLRKAFAERQAYRFIRKHIPAMMAKIEGQLELYRKAKVPKEMMKAADKILNEMRSPIHQSVFALERQTEWAQTILQARGNRTSSASGQTANDGTTSSARAQDQAQGQAQAQATDASGATTGNGTTNSEGKLIVPFVAQKDPDMDPSKMKYDDIFMGEFEFAFNDWDPKSSEQDRPSFLYRTARSAFVGSREFGIQSTLFNIPVGLVMIAQLGIDYSKDPLAWERFIHSLEDPVMHAGFAAFMATNHQVSHLLAGVMKGKISRHLIPYIGMSAGLLASSVLHDFWTDRDLWKCVSTKSVPDRLKSCDVAFDRWVTGKKINQYAPAIVSLCYSTLIATAIQQLGAAAMPQGRKWVRLALRGMRLVRQLPQVAGAAAQTGSAGTGPLGLLAANLIFIAVDTVNANYVLPWMQTLQKEQLDIYETLKRYTSLGAINNVSRVIFFGNFKLPHPEDITTMKEVRSNLKETLERAERTGWKFLDPLSECIEDKYKITLLSGFGSTRSCLFTINLSSSLAQYATVNREWRQTLLAKSMASEAAWREGLFKFSVLYIASNDVYRYIIESLHAKARGEAQYNGAPIDISVPALTKVLGQSVNVKPVAQRSDDEKETLDGLYPRRIGMTRTPELIDYLIAGMACNPRVDDAPSLRQYVSTLSFVPYFFGNVPKPYSPIVETPLGSSMRFVPPNITTHDGDICDLGPRRLKPHPGMKPEYANALANQTDNLHEATFINGEDGKPYQGLLSFVVDKINPALVSADQPTSEFNIWWDEKITPVAEQAWKSFGAEYKEFLKNNLFPTLTTRKTRAYSTCWGGEESASNNTAYDPKEIISCGAYHSMELEIRQYLSILRTIYLSKFKKDEDRKLANQEFLDTAQIIVDAFRGRANLANVEQSFDTDLVVEPTEELVDRLDKALVDKDDDYKIMTAAALVKQIRSILTERGNYRKMLTVLDFEEQDISSGPPTKSNGGDIRNRGSSAN